MQPALAARDLIGAALWLGAFTFEVVADRQKSAWRTARDNKEHDEKFSALPTNTLLYQFSFLCGTDGFCGREQSLRAYGVSVDILIVRPSLPCLK